MLTILYKIIAKAGKCMLTLTQNVRCLVQDLKNSLENDYITEHLNLLNINKKLLM